MERVNIGYFGAVRGTTIRRTVALPIAAATLPAIGTIISVFGWCVRCFQDSSSPLPSSPFALCSFSSALLSREARQKFFTVLRLINKYCSVFARGNKPLQCCLGQASVNGAVRGTTIRRTVALPIATTTLPAIGTIISVFGWCVRCFQHSSTSELGNGNCSGVYQKSPDLFQ